MMRKAGLFFHVACIGDHWLLIALEIMTAVIQSELYERADEIHIIVCGSKGEFQRLRDSLPSHDKVQWVHHDGSPTEEYEYPTLEHLSVWCRRNPDAIVCYVHTKGVSRDPRNPFWKYWRRYLVRSTIWEHAKHVHALDRVDVSGDMWMSRGYFSGNFWWANASHINILPDVAQLRSDGLQMRPLETRLRCEAWIGMRDGIRVQDYGVTNMKPGFEHRIIGPTDDVRSPLSQLRIDQIYCVRRGCVADSEVHRELVQGGMSGAVHRIVASDGCGAGPERMSLARQLRSHKAILYEALSRSERLIVVVEESVTFIEGFNEALSYALGHLPTDWELWFLGYEVKPGKFSYRDVLSDAIAVPNEHNIDWIHAYLVKNPALRIMVDRLAACSTADSDGSVTPDAGVYEACPGLAETEPFSANDWRHSLG